MMLGQAPGRGGALARNLQPSQLDSDPAARTTWDHLRYAKCSTHQNLEQPPGEKLRLPWHVSHLPQNGPCNCQISECNSSQPLKTTSSEYGKFPRQACVTVAPPVYWPVQRPSNRPHVCYRNHSLNL